jgi:hypothetical protein
MLNEAMICCKVLQYTVLCIPCTLYYLSGTGHNDHHFLDSTPSILNYKTFLTCTLLLVCKYTQCMSKCIIKVMYLEKPNDFIIAKMSYDLERND